MKIAVIGTGYVGLVTAAILADFGNQVRGVDIDKKKIASLKKGKVPFYEPGLKKIINRNLEKKRLSFTSSYNQAIPGSKIIFICVGTPAKKNGDYDLAYVYSAVKSVAKGLKSYTVICIKSTVPPTVDDKIKKIIEENTTVDFDLASCPEFLKEGTAVKDSLNPSRVVIGTETKKARDLLLKVHQPIKAPRLLCDIKSAQTIKYAANAFLATKISFINSIARICDAVGADIDDVALGLGLDPRIGKHFLKAGLGYGGSCFPKDTWALIAFAKRLGYDFKFLKEVDRINKDQINYFIGKVVSLCQGSLKNKTLAVLGLAFKPQTDDMREARSVLVIKELKKRGAKIKACDPIAVNSAKKVISGVSFYQDPYQALKGAQALLLVTEWPEFKKLDFKRVAKLMKEKVVIDGRNVFNPQKLKKLGFAYQGMGRK